MWVGFAHHLCHCQNNGDLQICTYILHIYIYICIHMYLCVYAFKTSHNSLHKHRHMPLDNHENIGMTQGSGILLNMVTAKGSAPEMGCAP